MDLDHDKTVENIRKTSEQCFPHPSNEDYDWLDSGGWKNSKDYRRKVEELFNKNKKLKSQLTSLQKAFTDVCKNEGFLIVRLEAALKAIQKIHKSHLHLRELIDPDHKEKWISIPTMEEILNDEDNAKLLRLTNRGSLSRRDLKVEPGNSEDEKME